MLRRLRRLCLGLRLGPGVQARGRKVREIPQQAAGTDMPSSLSGEVSRVLQTIDLVVDVVTAITVAITTPGILTTLAIIVTIPIVFAIYFAGDVSNLCVVELRSPSSEPTRSAIESL